jgi:hypothetical protein
VPSASPRARRPARRIAPALLLGITLVAASPASGAQPPADADPGVITTWNQIAVSNLTLPVASGGPGKTPPEAFLYLGFVHAAMYNAVVGITGEYELYRWEARAPKGASPEAAAAAAAHRVLDTYIGGVGSIGATLDAALANSLADIPDGPPKDQGIRYGERAADHIIAMREGDGRNAAVTVPDATEAGDWEPTPPGFIPFVTPWYGGVDPLLTNGATQFAPGPPPAINSDLYVTEFNEVRDYGRAEPDSLRTPEQTLIARFFAEIPVGPTQKALRDLVAARNLSISDAARMFAAVEMSGADALATVWHAKLQYMWWRPIQAIRLADDDGNPATASVANWTPLITTPPYPEWPSGLCSVMGSVTTVLDRLYGSVDLTITSPTWGTRSYSDKATLDAEAVSARVWSGIHFRTADQASITIGTQVADFALDNYFAPAD